MARRALGLTFMTLCVSTTANAQASGTSISVPRGGTITIDGHVADAEWRNAMHIEHPAGTVVRLLRDADNLYLGITSDRQGFTSLCVASTSAVHVLHASAALGVVTYRPRGDVWQSTDTAFQYSMRNTALDDAARSQRAAYLAGHGWVASTVRMSPDQRSQEMQIALQKFPLPFSIALARWLLTSSTSEWWPSTVTDHDGCFAQQLVRGSVPQSLTFKPSFWLTIQDK